METKSKQEPEHPDLMSILGKSIVITIIFFSLIFAAMVIINTLKEGI